MADSVADKVQDKQKEITFFDRHAAADDYDVFAPQASERLVDAFVRLTGLPPGARVADQAPQELVAAVRKFSASA